MAGCQEKAFLFGSVAFVLFVSLMPLTICLSTEVGNSLVNNGGNDGFFEVRLYNKVHFEGRYIKLKLQNDSHQCVNLPPSWLKEISSVDPTGCVILYAEQNCKGLRRRLERWSWGSSALKDISFDKLVSSMSPCPKIKKLILHDIDEL